MKNKLLPLILAVLASGCSFRVSTSVEPAPQLAPKLDFSYYDNAQVSIEQPDGFVTFASKILSNCPGAVNRYSAADCSGQQRFNLPAGVLIRTNKKGDVLSEKQLSGGFYPFAYFNKVAQTPDNGFVGSGNFYDPTTKKTLNLVKFNALGEQVWVKGLENPDQTVRNLIVLKSGHILVLGTTYRAPAGPGFATFTSFLLKLDPNGNTISQQSYGNAGQPDGGAEAVELENGNIVVAYGGESNIERRNSLLFFDKDLKALNSTPMAATSQLRFLAKTSAGFVLLTSDIVGGTNTQNLAYFSMEGKEIRKILVTNAQLFISRIASTPNDGIAMVASQNSNQLVIIRLDKDGTNLRLEPYNISPSVLASGVQVMPSGRVVGTFIENAATKNELTLFMVEPNNTEGFRKVIASGKIK